MANLKDHYSFHMEQQIFVEVLWDTRSKILYFRGKETDKNGCFLLLEVTKDEQNSVLVNLFNANTEKSKLSKMLKSVNNISDKQIFLGGDFNSYFDYLLES